MSIIKINNVSSETISNFYIDGLHSPTPNKNEERIKMVGKYGTTLVGMDWEDRTLTINCYISGSSLNEKLREMAQFLKVNEEVSISFENDPSIYYIGTFQRIDNISRKTVFSTTFDITFLCEPEIWKITNPALIPTIVSPDALRSLETGYIKGVVV